MASLHRGSFHERAVHMSPHIENWDDDDDFHGDLFAQSASSHANLSRSSRAPSLRSESAAGEEDWQVLLSPNDESSTKDAISSAKHAGIPIPTSVPSSALLGGTIKRLGKKPSRQKIHQDDDWADDLELPGPSSGTLKLKTPQRPQTPPQDDDDFEDWAEGGSLGIRFGGTRRDTRTRGSSVSAAMSPSMGSCMTLESEDDDFGGLVLPKEPIDFNAVLRKRRDVETDDDKTPQPEPRPPQEGTTDPEQQEEHEKVADADAAAPLPVEEAAPQADSEAVPEAQDQPPAEPEPQSAPHPALLLPPATLKSVPEDDDFFDDLDMGSGDILDPAKLTVNRNVKVNSNKPPPTPNVRATTTLTFTDKPKDIAPASLVREAATKRMFTKPARKRNFGDGSELDAFDDLPTSSTKENKYVKLPSNRAPSKMIRQVSHSKLPITTETPQPPTPKKTLRRENTPSFARDTASMGQKPYLIKQMNTPTVKNEKGMTYNPVLHRWEGNEGALNRFSSPVQEIKPLISHISSSRGVQIEKGMVFDPRKMCWLKLDPRHTGPLSPAASIGDESDPFADIEDLKDDIEVGAGAGGYFSIQGGPSVAQTPMETFVSEEFDLGPGFIRRQRDEEEVWRRRVEGWVGERREFLGDDWRWAIRDLSIEMAEHLPR
ncbi:putative cytokinesis regulator [Diplodia seriata]|uniref:Putative cytokinesis regulator n=1 Tax=Diplodia seriata TaxID=420778 RepID=A0A0G2ERP0_9PEZI|nr:putative cytokinesis regulator [Diplodia seriata]